MVRSPSCSKEGLNRGELLQINRGRWTAMEDKTLTEYVDAHGEGQWGKLPKRAGLNRDGKGCRMRWLNYLRPGVKRRNITPDEEELIIRLHKLLGNRWSLIAGRLPGRTDNEIKNYWNTNITKKVQAQASSIHHQQQPPSLENSLEEVPTPLIHQSNINTKLSIDYTIGPQPYLVQNKATRCSKHFIPPNPNIFIDQIETKQVLEEPVENKDKSSNLDSLTPIVSGEYYHNLTNFMVDSEMDENLLADLPDVDFSKLICEFSS